MIRRLAALSVLSLALAACGDRAPAADPAAEAPAAGTPAATEPAADPAPAAAGPAPTEIAAAGEARVDGYGPLDLGMTAEEARAAWTDGKLVGEPDAKDPAACWHLSPGEASRLAFMIERDLFVRYSSDDPDLAAPGGGKVGMTADGIRALYGTTVQESPHKYEQGAKYLSVSATGISATKVLFETDAAGKVTEWRVGTSPQVDYVEGCG